MKFPRTLILTVIIGILAILSPELVKGQADMDGGNLGIGIMAGEPTGVSVKTWNSGRSAFGIGAAWSLSGRNEAIHLHADYLLHSWFTEMDEERLAFYYGIGGRIIFADDPNVGARIPFGLNYVFAGIPFDIFVEAVPIIDFTPEIKFAGNGAVGIRYYF